MGRKGQVLLLMCILLLTGCAARGAAGEEATPAPAAAEVFAPEATPAPTPVPTATPDPITALVDRTLAGMNTGEKVGQLFFVRPDALDPGQTLDEVDNVWGNGVKELTSEVAERLRRYGVGGIVIFGKNLTSPQQLTKLVADMQDQSKVPLMFAVDEEGGAVSRLGSHAAFDLPWFPSAAVIGGEKKPETAEYMGRTIGEYLAMYGFAMDFAPVADVRTNWSNTVIGDRAFSSDAKTVSAMTDAMARGLLSRGIIPVYKHFPGHGDTAEDSHLGLATVYKSAEELRACEWLPYSENDLSGCGVMVGHIAVPKITGDMTPASLSETLVTGCLRGKLGFDGLVITDALSMQGITRTYTSGQAAVMALKAGCDVLLMPRDLREAYDAVLSALERGEISAQRLDESVRRILLYKANVGVLR